MATPTLSDLRALAIEWWREPGRPRLEVLTARVARAFTDSGAIVRARIESRPEGLALVVDLERGGTVITREWSPPALERLEDLADVYDPSLGASRREVAP